MSPRRTVLSFVMVLVAVLACTSREVPRGQCEFDSQCEAPQVCAAGYCRQPCRAANDCPPNYTCVLGVGAAPSACVPPTDAGAACRRDSDCPEGRACLDGICRAQCTASYDCQVINPAATCESGRCVVRCRAGYDDCDRLANNGCETDLRVTPTHCGACGTACAAAPNQDVRCEAGACVRTCRAGFGDCDGDAANGCEANLRDAASCGACGNRCTADRPLCAAGTPGVMPTCAPACPNATDTRCGDACVNTQTDTSHCGGCGNMCRSGAGATAVCARGVCELRCEGPVVRADCDREATNGCESVPATDVMNCGACGNACGGGANGSAACVEGACGVVCDGGFADCNRRLDDGCEVETRVDPQSCGMCGRACAAPANADATCDAGLCGFRCRAGFADCDRDVANGCEVNLQTSVANCGACGMACVLPGGTPVCSAGVCARGDCTPGFADCDGMLANGCETDTRTSATHCGMCGNTCAPANATGACRAGVCAVVSCNAGFADCDGAVANGCEARIDTPTACGACGRGCAVANGVAGCAAGACTVASCNAGFANCNGVAADGCEVATTTDVAHCGGCGRPCAVPNATPRCAAGVCAVGTCNAGFVDCNATASDGCEVNTRSDNSNCGTCGMRCPTESFCVGGTCTFSCSKGFLVCSAACVDPGSDLSNCGDCGVVCPARANAVPTCTGACGFTCNANFGDCDGVATNGCEANLGTTAAHCGACGRACSLANATASCAAGACVIASCNAGFADCDRIASNGCETRLDAVDNCGACGVRCGVVNGAAACTTGRCVVASCNTGFADCDGAYATGCEVNLQSTTASCGACGRACVLANATAGCASAACTVVSCNTGSGNCDGSALTGCETALTTTANCGICGRICAGVTNGVAVCAAGTCGFTCNAGYYVSGASCLPVPAPRLVGPLSGAMATTRQPLLRWALPSVGADGARVQLCRDRACATVIATFEVTGAQGAPVSALTPGVYFWRAFGRNGTNVGLSPSAATWEVVVPARDAPRATAMGAHGDVNGDGYADVIIGESYLPGAHLFLGAALGVPATPTRTLAGATGSLFGAAVAIAGDVNGDGFLDVAVGAPSSNAVYIYHGSATGLASTGYVRTSTLAGFGGLLARGGDLNGDGYGDLVVASTSVSTVTVLYGSAAGLGAVANGTAINVPAGARGLLARPLAAGAPIDGDVYDDLAIGYTAATGGVVHWFRGGAAGLVATSAGNAAVASIASVSSAGDMNGDGYADVLAGNSFLRTSRTALVFRGSASGLVTTSSVPLTDTPPTSLGNTVVTDVGDINGDGFWDVSVSSAGSARVYYGNATLTGIANNAVTGTTNFGEAVGMMGDANRDGYWDLLVGSPDNADTVCRGDAWLYSGGAAGVSTTRFIRMTGTSTACWTAFGISVAALWPAAPRAVCEG